MKHNKAAITNGLIELQPWNLPQETDKIIKTLGIACAQAGIRTGYLPNTSLERYRYTSLISNDDIEMKGAHQYVKTDPVLNAWGLYEFQDRRSRNILHVLYLRNRRA